MGLRTTRCEEMSMKKLMLWLMVFAVASAHVLHAQEIAGNWQGTLQPPAAGAPALRIVIQLSRAADQTWQARIHSIDQQGPPINGTVTIQGSTVKIAVPAINGTFEGRLSDDRNAITGTWTQGASSPLNLARATPATAWAIPEPPPPPKPMAADANLVFDVATIKPSNPANPGRSILVGRGGSNLFTTTNTTLNDLLTFAYDIHLRQIVGGPSWLESERFDITAKPESEGIPNATQLRAMVQKLLAERFSLAFHSEKREMPAYVITIGKEGPKLTKNESGGNLPGFGGRGPGAVVVRNSSMVEFAGFLQARILDRPVVDQTGVTGKFDFTLEWRPDLSQAGPAAPGGPAPQLPPEVEARPDLFTAIQEQLGLKLESSRAPVQAYVIDKVEKPSEN
jgi:uncharacterized protein (TIGR03435 family)